MNSLVTEADGEPTNKDRVEMLRCTLCEAELQDSMSTLAIHAVELEEEQKTSQDLGPTLTTDLSIEGAPVEAMIDTGSPVMVVSLEFMLEALVRQQPAEQSLEKVQVCE